MLSGDDSPRARIVAICFAVDAHLLGMAQGLLENDEALLEWSLGHWASEKVDIDMKDCRCHEMR